MAEYNLGTASGRIIVDGSPAEMGFNIAQDAAQAFFDSVQNRVKDLQNLGKKMAVAGAAGVAGFGLAVKTAADFEQGMAGVQAVSGATEDQMESLRQKALQLGKDTAYSAKESTGAMEELAKAGMSVEQILDGAADAVVALAAAGDIDIADAASYAAAAMNIFNMEAKDATRIADLMAGAANNSATTVAGVGDAFKYVAPLAAASGITIEDTTAAIAAMAQAGIEGGMAGTTLRSMLQRLIPQGEKAEKAMRRLGLVTKDGQNQFYNADGSMKSLAEVSGLLQNSLEGLTAEQKNQALATIFGQRALAGAVALANQGEEGFNDLYAAVDGTDAAEVAGKRLQGLSGDLTILRGSLETLRVAVGSVLLPALSKLVQILTKVVNVFLGLPDVVLKAMVVLALIASSGLILVGVFLMMLPIIISFIAHMLLMRVIRTLVGSFRLFYATLKGGGGIMAAQSAMFGRMGIAARTTAGRVTLLARVLKLLRAAWLIALGPVGLIIAAVLAFAAIGKILYDRWAPFRNLIDSIAAALRSKMMAAWEAIQPVIQATIAAFQRFGNFVSSTMLPVLQAIAAMLVGKLLSGWDAIKEAVISGLLPAWERLLAAFGEVGSAASSLWEKIQPLVSALGTFAAIIAGVVIVALMKFGQIFVTYILPILAKVVGFLLGVVIDAVVGMVTGIVRAVSGIIDIFAGLLNFFTGLFTGNWSQMWEGIKQIVSGVWDAIIGIVQVALNFGLLKAVGLGFALLRGLFRASWSVILSIFRAAWNGIRAVVMGGLRLIVAVIRGYANMWLAIFRGIWRAINAVVRGAINGVRSVVSGGIRNVTSTVSRGMNAVRDAFVRAWQAVRNAVVNAWNGIRNAVSSGIGRMMDLIRSIPGRITSALSGLAGTLYRKGTELIQGLINGIRDKIKDIGGAMSGVASKIGGFLPSSPVKEGPLTSWNRGGAGKRLVDMLTDGLESETRDAAKAALKVASAVHDGFAANLTPSSVRAVGSVLAQPVATYASTAKTPTPAIADKGSNLRLVEGSLRLDESGRAFISGVAQEVVDDNEQFSSVRKGMG